MLGRHSLSNRCTISRHCPNTSIRSHSVLKSQHNQAIVDLLLKHKKDEEDKAKSNNFKVQAFAKAIYAVLQHREPIRSGDDILKLPGIGRGITSRINEYFLADVTIPEKDPNLYQEIRKSQAVAALNDIPGIGPTTAKKLVEAGCLSVESLKSGKFSSLLTAKQVAKVKYADHLQHPVKGQDADDVFAFCTENLDSRYNVTLVGDYRRGISSFPEICLMISHPDFVHVPLPTEQKPQPPSSSPDAGPSHSQTQNETIAKKRPRGRRKNEEKTNLLQIDVVPLLQQRGLITETLSSSFKSWEGIVRLPGPRDKWGTWRERMDAVDNVDGDFRKMTIHFVPQKSRGSSLISLTGDSDFEKDICFRARQRGLLFNEYGLWKWTTNGNGPPSPHPTQSGESSTTGDITKIKGIAVAADVDVNAAASPAVTETGYWSLIKSVTEEDIFQELGMEFIDPTRRNFSYISGKSKPRKRRMTLVAPADR